MMKKLFNVATALLTAFLPLASSCEKEVAEISTLPKITIERSGIPANDQVCIIITPDENTAKYVYAIGQESDRENFEIGIMDGIEEVIGNSRTETTFKDLEQNTEYIIYARAFNSNEDAGPIVSYNITTAYEESLLFETQYITSSSAGIYIDYHSNYSKCECYLGLPSEKDAFLNGEKIDTVLFDRAYTEYYYNAFDLKESTDYTFFVRAYDRCGAPVEFRQYDIKTLDKDECPEVTMTVNHIDVYKADLQFDANEKTGKIYTMASNYNTELAISANRNNIMDMIFKEGSWGSSIYGVICSDGKQQLRTELNDMLIDKDYYLYVLLADNNNKPVALYKYKYTTPGFNPNAPEGKVEIEISDITEMSAKYTFICDNNVFGFLYGTIDAEWWDNFQKTPDYDDKYIYQHLLAYGKFAYKDEIKDGVIEYTEYSCQPQTNYYAVACPVTENGHYEGWLPAIFKKYTTK